MTGVILAAGKSTRTQQPSQQPYPKVLLQLNGRPVLDYVMATARQAGLSRIILIVGFRHELVEQALAGSGAEFAFQREQHGTADALLSCQNLLAPDEEIVVLSGDVPLVTKATLTSLIACHRQQNADLTLLTALVPNPHGYGRIIRRNGQVVDIIEEKDATSEQRSIKEMNVGLYAMRWGRILPLLKKIEPSPKTGETYLPKLVKLVADQGGTVCSLETRDAGEFRGINTLDELRQVEEELGRRTRTAGSELPPARPDCAS